ncbi:hypothetical protein [Streptomyces sp. NPDC054837]
MNAQSVKADATVAHASREFDGGKKANGQAAPARWGGSRRRGWSLTVRRAVANT